MPEQTKTLLQRMQEDAEGAADATLDEVRAVLRVARDLEMEVSSLEEKLEEKQKELRALREQRLVELFTKAGVRLMELEPEGNLPAYKATLKPFYKANIAADWPDDKRAAAFNWLIKNEHGDLIKWTFVVELPRDSQEEAERLRHELESLGLDYTEKMAVPHSTLTAWLKEQVEKKLPLPELELIGAQRGQVVDVKPVKEKQPRRS